MRKCATLFDIQDLAGVDLHLHLPIRLRLAQPAVAGEHVLLPVDRDLDLHAVQEPTGSHTLVGVANHQPVDLEEAEPVEQSLLITSSFS